MSDHAVDKLHGSAPADGANGHRQGANGSPGSNGATVIDLRDAPTTRVRVERENDPFAALSKPERMRLIIRVLCEIVAYGETGDDDSPEGKRGGQS